MVTISRIVDKIIEESPFIQEALARDLVNYVALAESVEDRVAKEMKKKVKVSAIAMAFRRKQELLTRPLPLSFDTTTDITIKSNLTHVLLKKTSETIGIALALQKKEYVTVTQGINEISLLYSGHYDTFPKECIQKITPNLSGITLRIPENFFDTPGFFYVISRALYLENINILDLMSTYTELTLIVHEEDVAASFEALRKLLHKR